MQVVLLAAGDSTRFYPFNRYGHKSFFPVMDKPIIYHTLKGIKETGITEVIIVVRKKAYLENLLAEQEELGLSLTVVEQPIALGMGDALAHVRQYIHDDFFLLHAHHVDFIQFKEMLEKEKTKQDEVVLLATHEDAIEKYGALRIEGKKVLEIVEKPKGDKIPSHLKVVGIYLLPERFFDQLEKTPLHHNNLEVAISEYAKDFSVTFVETQKKPISLKYPWDLFTISSYLLTHLQPFISPLAHVSPHAIVSGSVVIQSGAKVLEGACIKGPCYIGKDVLVGNNALLRNGVMLGEGSVVGANMEMKNVLLLHQTKTHSGFIGDSIIGKDCHIAAGICTGNVRLDRKDIQVKLQNEMVSTHCRSLGIIMGDGVKTGIHISTMPGVIIGNEAIIGPNTLVMNEVSEKTTVYAKFDHIVISPKE